MYNYRESNIYDQRRLYSVAAIRSPVLLSGILHSCSARKPNAIIGSHCDSSLRPMSGGTQCLVPSREENSPVDRNLFCQYHYALRKVNKKEGN